MRHSWSRPLLSIVGLFILPAAALSAQTPSSGKTASQAYLDYRAAFDKAGKIDDLLPFMSAARVKQVNDTPAGERAEMFKMIKAFDTTKNVKVVRETRSATGASLAVEGTSDGKTVTGTIDMVREGTAWKVDKESWKS
jgi:hypothetical protein